PGRFDGKTAIVTGAAGGIGRATALRLAAEGAQVLCVDVDGDGAARTAGDIDPEGTRAVGQRCDVTDREAVDSAVASAVGRLGGLDVRATIAGIGRAVHPHEETDENWMRTLDVNLTGSFYFCRAAIPHLLERDGAIVNTASTAGLQ